MNKDSFGSRKKQVGTHFLDGGLTWREFTTCLDSAPRFLGPSRSLIPIFQLISLVKDLFLPIPGWLIQFFTFCLTSAAYLFFCCLDHRSQDHLTSSEEFLSLLWLFLGCVPGPPGLKHAAINPPGRAVWQMMVTCSKLGKFLPADLTPDRLTQHTPTVSSLIVPSYSSSKYFYT